jgi:trigger factor
LTLAKNDIVKYVVTDAKLIDGQVERIQKQFGTAVPQEEVVAGADLTEHKRRKGINNATTTLWIFSKTKRLLINLSVKVGDVVTVNTKDLFEDAHQLMFESRS